METTNNKDTSSKDKKSAMSTDSALHSKAIKENLDNVNMEAWYYIYENYINPTSKKDKD